MKKIIFIISFAFLCFFMIKDADAAKKPSYENMLDMSQLTYNEETGFFCSNQIIELKKDTKYTVVASKNFFGERIVLENDLKGKFFGVSYKTYSGNNLVLGFNFSISETGLHYTSVTVPEDCQMTIYNFLSKGYTVEDFPKDEVVMFEGDMSLFDGFRRYSDLTGFEKVDEVISIYTDYDNKITVDTISESLVASDNQDGLITDVALVEDNYSSSTDVGEYLVIYEAKDSSNNTTRLNVNVKVLDVTKPKITGPAEVIWELGEPCISLQQIKELFTAKDNVDGDVTDKIKIKSSALESYSTVKEGKYMVVLEVKDKAGNAGGFNFFLTVKDTVAPTLELKDVTVNLSESFSSLSNLAKGVYVSSYDLTNHVIHTYSYGEYLEEMGFAGKFEITVTAEDKYGNKTTKTAYLTIVDDLAPEFYMKTELLNTNTQRVYSVNDVKGLIEKKLKTEGIVYEEVQLISSDYFSNEKNPGEYNVKFLYRYQDDVNYMVGTITVEPGPVVNHKLVLISIGAIFGLIIITSLFKRKRSMI